MVGRSRTQRRKEKWKEKNSFFPREISISRVCASQGLPSQPTPLRSTWERMEGRNIPDKMNEGRERELSPSPPPPRPRDTLKRFLFVRDSSRHRGITSFPFLAGSPARDVLLVPANLILKPRIRVAEYDEKREEEEKGGSRRISPSFFYGSSTRRREAIALYEAYAR